MVSGTTVPALVPEAAARLWAKVLGVARIAPDDELAEYGADSLDTARVAARLRQEYGLDVPFRVVFEASTPRALAEAVRGRPASSGPATAGPAGATADSGRTRWPLSHDQQRLWLLEQNGDGGAAYHLPLVLHLRGELDAVALQRAWQDLVARHGALRTRYVLDGHEPRQEVLDPVTAEAAGLPVTDLGGGGLAAAVQRTAGLVAPAFDLATAPPWRIALYRLAPDEHVLAFVVHHIAFDGWSEEVLRRELSELYAAHRTGRTPSLPPLAATYTDHARWQRERAGSPAEAADLEYWRGQLAGATPLDLPTDRPRPPDWTGAGAGHTFTVDAGLAGGVRALARAHGATPFMATLAAWSALLGRLCDSTDVVVGASTADRGRPELEDLVGMFVNVLVIRTDLGAARSFRELLGAVRQTTLDAFAHQDVPFDRLVAELAPDRRAARTPLFNVNFVYLNQPAAGESWPDLEVRQVSLPAARTAFDLILAVQDQPDGSLRCYLEYSTELFDDETAQRIGRCYRRLLAGCTADPDAALGSHGLLDAAERRALLVDANAATEPLPAQCLHTVVEEQAGRAPDAVAVACGDRTLSYAQLDAAANRLARFLRGQGVGPETGVAVWLPRSADQVVAMLAVWKAGGYYVPLDDEHPADRIAMMLADAAPLVLVTRGVGRISAGERAGVAKVVCLDRDGADVAALPAAAPAGVAVRPDGLAAAIYTSGSTGTPKAVALTHRNVLAGRAARTVYQAPPRSLLLPVSFAFDVFLSFAAWTLCEGGRLVVPVQSRGADLDELAGLLRTQWVTHLVGPPDLQRALLARDDVRGGNHLVLGVVGGQSCPQVLAEDYARCTAGARLVNEYGLTETSAGTFFATDGTGPGLPGGQLPIGRPAANHRVYLLDANLLPVPVGVTAEVYLGGAGIARGYLNRPVLTAERFLPDPVTADGQRLYRTGDLARWRNDGTLEFVGRRDRQVKIRGFRIELAEIEAALLRHEAVGSAAVCHLPQRQELVGYVVGAGGARPEAARLRTHLQELLPEPMVPSAFVVLDAMPLTPNGKIDRAALAELDVAEQAAAEPPREHTGPRTPAERTVAEVWAEVLPVAGADAVDVHTNFFELGGHSLLAANVVSRLRSRFPVPLGMQDLFASPTVAGLAELIGARMLEALQSQFGQRVTAGAGPATVAEPQPVVPVTADEPITPTGQDGPAPLSAGQQQLWLVDRIESGSVAYQVPLAARLVGPLDVAALRRALDDIVARHEVLRTRIALDGDEPVQVVDPPRAVSLPVLECRPAGLDELLADLAAEPIDLAADLMLRAALVRLAEREHVLLVVLHHIATDAASVRIVADELAELYAAHTAGREPGLAPPPLQYRDYARWYRRRADGAEHRAQLDYWRRQLDGVAPLWLPADRPAGAGARGELAGRRVEFGLDRALVERARALAAKHGATPYMVLLTAFKALLTRIGAGTDIAVGTPVSGRGRTELDGLVGYFGNTIVLRTELPGELTFLDALDRVRRVTADGLARQEVAFARVVEEVAPERGRSATPLFNVMFSYEDPPQGLPAIGELSTAEVALPVRTAQFDLTLRMVEQTDGTMRGQLDYATALFDAGTASGLAGRYERVLRALLDQPQAPIESVPLLDDADRRRLAAWNETARDYPLAPLGQLLADQVARTPDAPAVWADGRWSSYREFTDGVHRLAHHLRAAGVGVDDVVGVCLPRGGALVTAVHAVVAAGAAYLPLPPDLPASRLAMMTDDARPAAVVTTADLAAQLHPDVPLVRLDADAAAIAARPASRPEVRVPLDALAYVIFTSGSTGRPKGVAVSHRAIANRLLWMQETFPLDGTDRVLHKTPFSFDVSVWELFWPLVTGAGMVVAGEGGHRDFGYLADLAADTGATTVHFVPSILAMFLDEPGPAGRLGALRRVVCSGEALTADLVARFRAALPGVELHNLYGPTEAAVDVSWHPCTGDETVVPIGRPVANTRLEVLDRRGQRVPVGVPGELCLGGVQLARGYVGQPALTAQRFVADPFADRPGERLYRTGDLARWRADGTVEYLGRLDHQVKIRGVRIEPGEIEAALRAHPRLTGAVVLARGSGAAARLVAYVECPAAAAPSAAELREHLRGRLPAAMIPAQFVVLPRFPLTDSGKLDRKALPAPRPGGSTGADGTAAERVAPRTPRERLVAEEWAAVLRIGEVGVLDDFFEVGGNSIRAVQLAGRLAGRGLPVSVQDLFVHRTVAALAALDVPAAAGRSCLEWFRGPAGSAVPPLCCVHPGDGSPHWFAALADALPGDHPVAAFEWPGLREPSDPGDVPAVAARYLTELRAAVPTGPYRLLGWCGGAAVTWELARQLAEQGHDVRLYLLDPVIDVAHRANFHDQLAQFERCEELFAALATAPDAATAAGHRADIVAILRQAIDDPEVSVTDDDVNAAWRARLRGWRQLLEANLAYPFRPYPGRLRLLVGDELRDGEHLVLHGLDYDRYLDRWRELATGGVDVHHLPGDHLGVLRQPHVARLADLLAADLEERP